MRLALALTACALSACVTDVAITEAAITRGARDPRDEAVGALRIRRAVCGEPAQLVCSGSLIAPRVFLTAAHCVTDLTSGILGLDQLEVVFGEHVEGAGIAIVDAAVAADDDFDLALLELASAPPIAPLARGGPEGAELGDELRLVGFGQTSPTDGGGARLGGAAVLSAIDATTLRLAPAPSVACDRDSGGAVLRLTGDVPTLVGVIRSGDAACASVTVATRVDAQEDAFLAPFVAAVGALDPEARPPPDVTADFCAVPCAIDDECPAAMRCLPDRSGARRCGYAGLGPGTFGEPCERGVECASGACAAIGTGDEQDCRCFVRCPTPTAAAAASCSVQPSRSRAGVLIALSLLALVARRRRYADRRNSVGLWPCARRNARTNAPTDAYPTRSAIDASPSCVDRSRHPAL
ncbi:Hypothetical protein I5071_34350 [Sandaracinus amylolyticus]|nr:Hypothetical protein I5071_34350 [Sandaracinus amylolyticus]